MGNNLRNQASLLRRELAKDFRFFREYYFPDHRLSPDAPFHRELCEIAAGMDKKRGYKFALASPRGSAKSTILALEFPVFCICNKTEDYMMFIGSTHDQAQDNLSHVKEELLSNERLFEDFPEVCEIGTSPKPPRWRDDEIITKNGVKITALGTLQEVRGRKHGYYRPSLLILDDIERDNLVRSPENSDKLYDWFTRSLLKVGSSKTNIILLGTIHHYNSLISRFTNKQVSPGWDSRIYQAVISWSKRPELWQAWSLIYHYQEEFEGQAGPAAARSFFERNKEAMLEGTQVLWPQRMDYYSLMVIREEDGLDAFASEYQNDPVSQKDHNFNIEDIRFWDDRYKTEEDLLITQAEELFPPYGGCDPSLGRQSRRGDFSAIVTIVRNKKTGIMYVLDADVERRSPDKTIEDIIAYHKIRSYKKFAFEANQFQEFMADELRKRADMQGVSMDIKQIKNSVDKIARIQALQPLIKSGVLQFSRRHRILVEQALQFPFGRFDDALDSLQMVVKIAQDDGRDDLGELVKLMNRPDRPDGAGQRNVKIVDFETGEITGGDWGWLLDGYPDD